jgi:hypothetical protein
MKMIQLRKALSSYERLLDDTQADAELRMNLARLNAWLSQFDKLDVDEVCSSTGAPPSKLAKAANTQSNTEIVDEFSARLGGIGNVRADLERVLSEMKSDKRVRVSEASEIAQRYVGGTSKYKSKADALKEIKLRFEAGLRAAQRIGAASEIY